MKIVRIILSQEAEKAYELLSEKALNSKIEKSLIRSIREKFEIIKQNIHYGKPVAKNLIPEQYLKKFGIKKSFQG